MKRRRFLKTASSSALPFFLAPQRAFGANERLQIAAIGVGGKGRSDFDQLARHGEVIAACDVDDRKLDYALKGRGPVSRFSDYREMFHQLRERIDVVSISAPDHVHAHAANLALQAGIHLFVQTPLVHTIWEASRLLQTAREKGACLQLGLQGCAQNDFRRGVEFLRSGGLGAVREIHAWDCAENWPQAPIFVDRPSERQQVPSGFDWDAFLGTAPHRPYHSCYHPYKWRGWQVFGTGVLGHSGIHLLNLPFMGCRLDAPSLVKCLDRGPTNEETYPAWGRVCWEFDQIDQDPVSVYWREGRIGNLGKGLFGQPNLPDIDQFLGFKASPRGFLIKGSEGEMFSDSLYGSNWMVRRKGDWLGPDQLRFEPGAMGRNGRGDSGMKEELIGAIRRGDPNACSANLDYGSKITELILLGNASLLAGGEFSWNAKARSSNRADVNARLTKNYRKGWGFNP